MPPASQHHSILDPRASADSVVTTGDWFECEFDSYGGANMVLGTTLEEPDNDGEDSYLDPDDHDVFRWGTVEGTKHKRCLDVHLYRSNVVMVQNKVGNNKLWTVKFTN